MKVPPRKSRRQVSPATIGSTAAANGTALITALNGITGWAPWLTQALLTKSLVSTYPVYASLLTPVWMRALGTRVAVAMATYNGASFLDEVAL